ncbi:MAG TPA: hypothetical protein VFV42_00010 [Acidimicrobiales bacterium]|nr:hypothetical protein [Acidimicrobiales bacterium]
MPEDAVPPPTASLERAKHGSFRELFPAAELKLYAAGTIVFIVLAVLTHDVVLNWIIGPLFITVWAWYVPVLQERWRERRRS